MAIIDKRGKVFGLINVVDLLVMLIIIVLAIGGIYKFGQLDKISNEGSKEIGVTLMVEEINEGLINAIKEGDLLIDTIRGTDFGTVLDKTVTPHEEMVIGKDGKVEFKEIPGSYDVVINLSSNGSITNDGVLISNNSVYIGSEVRLKSSLYVFDSKIMDIRE